MKEVLHCQRDALVPLLFAVLFFAAGCAQKIDDVKVPIIPIAYPDIDATPHWSADGTKIVYFHAGITMVRGDGSYEIDPAARGLWVVDTLGVDPHLLVRASYAEGEASRAGDSMAFSTGQLFTVELLPSGVDSTTIAQLTTSGNSFNPSWSPGDSLIAYESDGGGGNGYDIWTINRTGAGARMLPAAGRGVSWFPSAEKIAYHAYTRAGSDIRVLDLVSGQSSVLTIGQDFAANPAVSPDGTNILYEHGLDIWIMNADGNQKKRLLAGSSPTWAPDGIRFAFVYRPEGEIGERGTIWISDIGRTHLVQVTRGLSMLRQR